MMLNLQEIQNFGRLYESVQNSSLKNQIAGDGIKAIKNFNSIADKQPRSHLNSHIHFTWIDMIGSPSLIDEFKRKVRLDHAEYLRMEFNVARSKCENSSGYDRVEARIIASLTTDKLMLMGFEMSFVGVY